MAAGMSAERATLRPYYHEKKSSQAEVGATGQAEV